MGIALITGGSRGLGFALTRELLARDWRVVIDGRDRSALKAAGDSLSDRNLTAVAGNVSDPAHRDRLHEVLNDLGPLDLLVNNASTLGPTPLPALARYPLDELEDVFRTNVIAPLALIQRFAAQMTPGGTIVNITSDAAVEPYEGWGGYGASKAALDQLTAVLGAENPELRVYSFDPGDMRTEMHQAAFPGEDISDRAEPASVAPAILRLIERRVPGGRYRRADLELSVASAAS
jgi:NAD(P)-dependent dehydrogenase (short-subunit alcohol dehydrogenase family)